MTLILNLNEDTGLKGHRISYSAKNRPAGKPNTIELRAKSVQGVAEHLFWVYTDSHGKAYYLGGYPKNLDLTNFGPIIVRAGEYKHGTSDFKPYVRLATISGDSQSVYNLFQEMVSRGRYLHAQKIPYRLAFNESGNQNSNSLAMTVGQSSMLRHGVSHHAVSHLLKYVRSEVNVPGATTNLYKRLTKSRINQSEYSAAQTPDEAYPVLQASQLSNNDLREAQQPVVTPEQVYEQTREELESNGVSPTDPNIAYFLMRQGKEYEFIAKALVSGSPELDKLYEEQGADIAVKRVMDILAAVEGKQQPVESVPQREQMALG
jgi:hypothetical protein